MRGEPLPHAWPHFAYRFGPYLTFSFFDPDDPLRYEVGAQFRGDYMIRPGLAISTDLRLPLFGTMDKVTRVSNSVLPHVRSDWAKYARESTFRINRLTTDYYWRPGKDLYAKVSAGYLEEMFGGVAGELLWYPQGSKLALGGEIAYARQRDYDMLLGFRDYDVVTGHASIYYDLPAGFRAQVDAGRYLAGDWGATFALDREFNNGFKVGAFFTRTNVSAAEFGEGSFDKGIRFEIPLSWFTREPTRETFGQTIRPLMRDGGARLNLANRLYDYTRDANGTQLANRWGAVLQMIGRATRFLALVALAACSNAANEDDVFVKALNLGGDKVVPRAQALYDAGAPRIVIGIPKTDRSAIMVLEARRDGLETWLSADGAAVILDRGLLRGTRGAGRGASGVGRIAVRRAGAGRARGPGDTVPYLPDRHRRDGDPNL
ncbi:YjbH domain-containing protein [Jhaorihella thermophila]